MKYAIISDIHGNHPALIAALADVEKQKVDKTLFLGDYYMGLPWGNEVVATIRKLDSTIVIRGNQEGYLAKLRVQDQREWTHEQNGMLYWSYRALSLENLEFLSELPETNVISDGDSNIYIAHSSDVFFRVPKIKSFHSSTFCALIEEAPFTHEEYLVFASEEVLSYADVRSDINALSEGVYLFGHNHLQFHMSYNDRLFVNPGSCGFAYDFDPPVSYTLLERTGNDWIVTERRVNYSVSSVVEKLHSSGFSKETPEWSKIIERSLLEGRDYLTPFTRHIAETGLMFGQTEMPVNNGVWDAAIKTWDADKAYSF